jgi:hypothetical protein
MDSGCSATATETTSFVGIDRLAMIAIGLIILLLLSACSGGGNTSAGPDPGGGFYCPNNAYEGCVNP